MSNALNELRSQINQAVAVTNTVFNLKPGKYNFTIGDGGSLATCRLQYFNGAAYVNFAGSDGTASQSFQAYVGQNGLIRLTFGAGSAVFGAFPCV